MENQHPRGVVIDRRMEGSCPPALIAIRTRQVGRFPIPAGSSPPGAPGVRALKMTTILRCIYRLALLSAAGVGVSVGLKTGINAGVTAFLIGLLITATAAFLFEIALRSVDRVSRRIGL